MKQNKFKYLSVIQQNFAGYWEDVSEYETNSSGHCFERVETTITSKRTGMPIKRSVSVCSQDYKEYVLSGYPTRIISRKELNTSLV